MKTLNPAPFQRFLVPLGALVLILRADGTRRALRFAGLWENS